MENDPQTRAVIGAAMEVHRELGPGFLRGVYRAALAVKFGLRGIPFAAERSLAVSYKGETLSSPFIADYVCYGSLFVEPIALGTLTAAHESGMAKQLKGTGLASGLLLNFGGKSLQPKRVAGLGRTDLRVREEEAEFCPQITQINADFQNGEEGDPRTYAIIGAAMEAHRELGHRFSEAIYKAALALELQRRNIPYRLEVQVPILYKGTLLPCGYRADSICFEQVVLELKVVDQLIPAHQAQLLNELKATKQQLGLLLNFGSPSLQQRRVINSDSQSH